MQAGEESRNVAFIKRGCARLAGSQAAEQRHHVSVAGRRILSRHITGEESIGGVGVER
jgi:hypothetical protein